MISSVLAHAAGELCGADSAKVDGKKDPKHAATQLCSNCPLYPGKAGDASGPCGIFPGKHVAAKGWCSAYVKKA